MFIFSAQSQKELHVNQMLVVQILGAELFQDSPCAFAFHRLVEILQVVRANLPTFVLRLDVVLIQVKYYSCPGWLEILFMKKYRFKIPH